MSDIVRFRVARSPRRLAENDRGVYRVLRPGEQPSAFLSAVRSIIKTLPGESAVRSIIKTPLGKQGSEEPARRDALAMAILNAVAMIGTDQNFTSLIRFLRELDIALLTFVPAPTAGEFNTLLRQVVASAPLDLPPVDGLTVSKQLVGWQGWNSTRTRLGDALVLAHLMRFDVLNADGPTVTGGVDSTEKINRLFLLVGLIEAVANDFQLQSAADMSDLIFRRTVLLPSPPFPLQVYVPLLAATRFARRPAFVDLAVVREEWCCFVPGEVAHIENVLKGELKERTEHQLEEREITDSREDSSLQVHEDSNEKTERSSFKDDVQRELQLSVALEGQVDLSGSYGMMQFAAHVGAEVELGYSQTEHNASEQAREVVDRVANRQEERVRKVRTERTLRRSEEKNFHQIDNAKTPTGHVVGIYRWVDKITRLRDFIYPHRFVFEFQLAEPGARLRWLEKNQPPPEMLTPVPPALTLNGKADGSPLSPEQISRNNYLQLAGTFHAQGVPDPDPQTVDIAGVIELKAEQTLPADPLNGITFVPRALGKAELAVPPGYLGVKLRAAMAVVPQLAKWRGAETAANNYFEDRIGYHTILATVSVGSARINLHNIGAATSVAQSFDSLNGIDMPTLWKGIPAALPIFSNEETLAGPLTQHVSIAATLAGSFHGHATVALKCDLSDQAVGEWQLAVYERLVSAQQTWQSRYDDERRNNATATGIAITGESPAKNRERIHEELKRQIIELIMWRDFEGYQLIRAIDSERGPLPNFSTLAAAAPTIQFLEQAFEWQNMSYVPYPFYWSDRHGWPQLERLRANDADWERFLRSGSARVVVPARRGYEYAVEYYAVFGEPWSGGAAPAPDDPLYVSVAQEIRELTGGGDQGKQGSMWESRQPTTLVWLDSDSSMPKRNDYSSKAFDGEPNPRLCPEFDHKP